MAPRSLLAQMLGWLLVPLAASVALNAWVTYRNAVKTATVVQDRLLIGSARIIAQQIRFDDGVLQVLIPPAALELFQSSDRDRVYYRIASPQGSLLSGYAELPAPPAPINAEESLYFSTVVRDQDVRVVAYAQPVFGAAHDGPIVIEVAQTMQAHSKLVRQISIQTVIQQLMMLVLIVVLAAVALRRGMAPILRLRDKVQGRAAGVLEPLDPEPVPHELQPLVYAINDYIKRLDLHLSARSRFIANAAHQLRTPLTVLQTQVSYAMRSLDIAPKDEALRAIQDGVQHGTRLVNQLLSLSAAEAGVAHPFPSSSVALAELVTRALEQSATFAQAKGIDLGFDRQGDHAVVSAPPWMLHELVANLLDNAIRYTPANGVVTASLQQRGGIVTLRIEDNGPGIPVAERERVFDRFYRLHEDRSDGCGLGLSIVREVAVAIGASVELADPARGAGLVVTVTFPAAIPVDALAPSAPIDSGTHTQGVR